MKYNKIIKLSYLFIIILFVFITSQTVKASVFNPNNIISDDEMLNADSMTLSEIQSFLNNKGGYISRHKFTDAFGKLKTAAEIIYEASHNYECDNISLYRSLSRAEKEKQCKPININPKLLLVLLQKEQSLIDHQSPSQKKLDWATGYGVCDSCSMDDPGIQRFKGFGKQINSAALQFYDYIQNPHYYTYKANHTYTISNTNKPPSIVTPVNQATAALYNYTPHVYDGNYNFFKLWTKYFTRKYPNNTLLQAKGEVGVWLIQNNKKRPFLTKSSLTSRYDINKIIQVSKSVLDSYEKGAPIKFPEYSLIRSPRGTIFLLVGNKRRGFASGEAFRKIGYNPEEIMNASWEDINSYEEGEPLTVNSTYPTGALLQDKTTGGIYYVSEGTKAPLLDAILLKTKFKRKSITPETPEKLNSYKTVKPVLFDDGELLKSNESRAVYIIDEKKKRLIISGKIFEELGYDWNNIIPVPTKILNLYPDGEPLNKIFSDEEITD